MDPLVWRCMRMYARKIPLARPPVRLPSLLRCNGPSCTAVHACRYQVYVRKIPQCQPGNAHKVGCKVGRLGALGEGSRPLVNVKRSSVWKGL
eukprot:162518-Chlamydomonas_euryale.AAC.2